MILNSGSLNKNNTSNNLRFGRLSTQTRFNNYSNCSVRTNKKISKFNSMTLNKSKNRKTEKNHPRINIIINNNNPINYKTSSSSMFINSFSAEKSIKKNKNTEINSTFVFTGDNQCSIDNGQIIENYLKNPIFECKSLSTISKKDQTEIIPSQEKSFFLSSSLSSNTPNTVCTLPKKKNNKNLIKMLKLINSESGNKKKEIISQNNQKENKEEKGIKKVESFDSKSPDSNIKKRKIILFILLFVLNSFFLFNFIIKMFQPRVNKLFYDNDHNDYIYSISLLSKEKSIVINEEK
jgi:hypothetical protein